MNNNILAVGAHPDDIEFGCGGTIAKHLQLKDSVYVLIMTNGEKGSHSCINDECLNSLKSLGLKKDHIFFGNFADGFIKDDQKTVSFIENLIKKLNIKKVYTHYPKDRHQDHRYCGLAVSSAARKVPEILLFQGPSTSPEFEPHYFVDLLKENLDKKMKSLEAYKSQISKGIISLKLAEGLSKINGFYSNTEYAEAFEINHIVKGKDNV